ncbi:MAG: type II toxin-antitoxin system RelE/ParE family toxin [Clostridia bacterium]|nr:type II toxin-antitoxin system RelE/ParE family toxin [Clostridia bacterium]MBQ2706850.1 type II toxin-antitoxin system RelE/ParE family toxin [Clostridia bacterium]
MKRYSVYFNPLADQELEQIQDYIRNTLLEPLIASRQIDMLIDACLALETMPYEYPVVEGIRKREFDIHKKSVGNYVIFYMINESESYVSIEHILHGRQNWRAKLI